MDPVSMIVVPGFLGGLIIALVVFLRQRGSSRNASLTRLVRAEPLSTDIINMSSIKVAGVGGLGLVAMALAVALDLPRIGLTIGLGLVLGMAFALVMIVRRRASGSMPSSGQQPGANTTLAIDAEALPDVPRPGRGDRDLADLVITEV
jgi:hypothetical protein